jgi:hypothetical protein
MTDLSLFLKLQTLPNTIKGEVLDFIEFLLFKKNNRKKPGPTHPKAGCMKGTFQVGPGFDDPIPDFKDYM